MRPSHEPIAPLVALTTLEIYPRSVGLTTPPDFLAANKELKVLKVTCRKSPTQITLHGGVSPRRVHQVELSSLMEKLPVLLRLYQRSGAE